MRVSLRRDPRRYQAWSALQCGQVTVVDTAALNTQPQWQLYDA